MRTGHTSLQAPQREDAKGNQMPWSCPTRVGVMVAPIGPEYVNP